MADFVVKNGERIRTQFATIASATVIEIGDLVALTAGIIVKADASSAELALAVGPSAVGDVLIEVSLDSDFTLTGTADANFAVTDKGLEVDLVISGVDQLIDIGASTTDVLKVGFADDSGVAGSAANVEVRINKHI